MVGGMRGCCGRGEVCGRGRGVCWEGWRGMEGMGSVAGGVEMCGRVEECDGRGKVCGERGGGVWEG